MGALQLNIKSWILASGSVPPSASHPTVFQKQMVVLALGRPTHLEQRQGCRPSPRAPTGGWGGEKEVGSGQFSRDSFC